MHVISRKQLRGGHLQNRAENQLFRTEHVAGWSIPTLLAAIGTLLAVHQNSPLGPCWR